jgi:hypothetical protein
LFSSLTHLSIPTKGEEFKQFMNNFNAVIKECFTSLAGLRIATKNAHDAWHKAAYDRKPNSSAKDDAELAIILKIYQKLGGTHLVPGTAMAYSYNKVDKKGNNIKIDILDYLEPEVKEKIEI